MRLTSTGLGIGTSSPAGNLNVNTTGNTQVTISAGNTGLSRLVFQGQVSNNRGFIDYDNTSSVRSFIFRTNEAEAMRLDSSGNLGLGVTPSASWTGGANLQIGLGAVYANSSLGACDVSYNSVRTASNSYVYAQTGLNATRLQQRDGAFNFFTALSGTAGDPISFTQAMTLDGSGNLGVGTTSPQSDASYGGFTVNGASGSIITLRAGNSNSGRIYTTTVDQINIDANGTASGTIILRTGTGSTERARITSGGNFKIGGSADRATTEGDKQLVLFDGTAPVGTLANGVSFYSASGEANVMDAAGNATLLSPHDAETNEWIFRSKHTPTGKVLKIDVERLLKFVNDHFGLDAVHEFIEA
jgi:hypothetical protein